jgi:hypothetical protein
VALLGTAEASIDRVPHAGYRSLALLAQLVGLSIALAVTLALSPGAAGSWIPRFARFLADANRVGAQFSIYPVAIENWRGLLFSLLNTDSDWPRPLALLALTIGSDSRYFTCAIRARLSAQVTRTRVSPVAPTETQFIRLQFCWGC